MSSNNMEYGNFDNYYTFNNAEERIKLLPTTTEIWLSDTEFENSPYLVLDIGCNVGSLTQMLWQFLKSILNGRDVFILGIDRDNSLIDRAIVNNTHCNISYAHFDVMSKALEETPIDQFLRQKSRKQFDAVCCFSITMWIHINHNDSGLQDFLKQMSAISKLLIIEPQPWKCYQTAKRRLKRSGKEFLLFKELRWRNSVETHICDYLKELNRNKVYECDPTVWRRKVCFYR